jgi:hypothetical protein
MELLQVLERFGRTISATKIISTGYFQIRPLPCGRRSRPMARDTSVWKHIADIIELVLVWPTAATTTSSASSPGLPNIRSRVRILSRRFPRFESGLGRAPQSSLDRRTQRQPDPLGPGLS